ncbi:MAG: LLM class flavin-dependent oxidoreductase [Betaproteobacteria bacterium]|nr:LLM class flavin-dependent oxidoreductase [Betaproteobacteria bacterium]
MSIQFGVFDHMDRGGRSIGEVYAMRLALCEAYDDAGFRAYHIAEHHATSLGMSPSPGIFLSAVAQRTKRLRLGPAVYVLPTYEPLRLIEEICMLDQLSGGRFELGVGRGFSPFELAYFGVGHLQSRARFDEVLEIVKKGLSSDVLNHKGPVFNYVDVPMVLQPVQRPHPPIWQGVTRVESAAQAARNGVNMIANGPVDKVRPATERYRTEWKSTHGEAAMPLMGLTRHIHVADTDKQAEATARQAYGVWYHSNAELWRRFQTESLIFPKTYDEAMRNKVAIVGSPETVRARIAEDMNGSGCNYFVGRYAFGDMTLAQVLRCIELMKLEVMPRFSSSNDAVAA